jgi:hypothetical protein
MIRPRSIDAPREESWAAHMQAGRQTVPDDERRNGCGECSEDGPCGECRSGESDPTHQRARWADLVASSRTGATEFWRTALMADTFLRPSSERLDPNVARYVETRRQVASQGSQFTDRQGVNLSFDVVSIGERVPPPAFSADAESDGGGGVFLAPPPGVPQGSGAKCCVDDFRYPIEDPTVETESGKETPAPQLSTTQSWRMILAARIVMNFAWSAVFKPGKVCKCACCEFRQKLIVNELTLTCDGTRDLGYSFGDEDAEKAQKLREGAKSFSVKKQTKDANHEDCYVMVERAFYKGEGRDSQRASTPAAFPVRVDPNRIHESVKSQIGSGFKVISGPHCPGHRSGAPATAASRGSGSSVGFSGTGPREGCDYSDRDSPSVLIPNNCDFKWHFKSEGSIVAVKNEMCTGDFAEGSPEHVGTVEFTVEGSVDANGKADEPRVTLPAAGAGRSGK